MGRLFPLVVILFISPLGCASILPVAEAGDLKVEYRSSLTAPNPASDAAGREFRVRGLSGITHVGDDRYLAVMDNSNRVIALRIKLGAKGEIESAAVTGVVTLKENLDFEGIALSPHEPDAVYLAHEGSHKNPPDDSANGPPGVRKYSLGNGTFLRKLRTPATFARCRPNLGFESLAISPDGGQLWTGNEEALTIDGPSSTQKQATTIRLLRYALAGETYALTAQYAYEVDRCHATQVPAIGPQNRGGLSDLVFLPDGRLLALERSFVFQGLLSTIQARIYLLDFNGATDVSSFDDGLLGKAYRPVAKRLLWAGEIGNLEGLCVGQALPNGHVTLIGVTDANGILADTVVSFELNMEVPATQPK